MPQQGKLQIETITSHRSILAEGPVWDAATKTICWIDIVSGIIHQYSSQQKVHRSIPVHQMIGSFAVCTNGNFIAALQHGFAFIDRKTGAINMIADPEAHLPNNRFNEGKCDPAGRFWAGTMSLTEDTGAGSVYTIHSDLKPVKKIEAVTISNGMAWNSSHTIFYYIDTPTYEIVSYAYDKATARISNKKVIIKIDEKDGYPDGMTIDDEGMLWIAHWGGWQVTRWNPRTAEKLYSIQFPAAQITCCTFGGDNFTDLYITSAKKGLNANELTAQPLAGSLFIIKDCGFKGLPAFEFEG